ALLRFFPERHASLGRIDHQRRLQRADHFRSGFHPEIVVVADITGAWWRVGVRDATLLRLLLEFLGLFLREERLGAQIRWPFEWCQRLIRIGALQIWLTPGRHGDALLLLGGKGCGTEAGHEHDKGSEKVSVHRGPLFIVRYYP